MFNYNRKVKILPTDSVLDKEFDYSLIQKYDENIKRVLINFINTLSKRHFYDLSIFNNNLSTLTFSSFNKKDFYYDRAFAYYDWRLNNISFKDLLYVYHELLHSSSTIYSCNIFSKLQIKSGFEQINGNKLFFSMLGEAFNEGYTYYLDSVLFGNSFNSNENFLVKGIVNIFGEKLDMYYSTADLDGFLELMERYSDRKETILFLSKMDFISNYIDVFNVKLQKEVIGLYYECIIFVLKCNLLYFLELLDNNQISLDKAQEAMDLLVNEVPEYIFSKRGSLLIPYVRYVKENIPQLDRLSKDVIKKYRL